MNLPLSIIDMSCLYIYETPAHIEIGAADKRIDVINKKPGEFKDCFVTHFQIPVEEVELMLRDIESDKQSETCYGPSDKVLDWVWSLRLSRLCL